jgi:transcriptional regulator with GAF, ATPase, and Fis domain
VREDVAVKIWRCFFDEVAAETEAGTVALLARAGVDTDPVDPDAADGPGAVFFTELCRPLCELMRQVSRNGLERVLAIGLGLNVLPSVSAWSLLQAGASDVFVWSRRTNPAAEVADRFARWNIVDSLVESAQVRGTLIGQSRSWRAMLRQIVEVARFTATSVLITGETGTGKELVARLIHALDPNVERAKFVVLDCTTIVPELSGSEFFGHERGAFTGAVASRDGAFALADGGTLFLDEVGELPAGLQAQLLRAIQEHTYKRVGGNSWQQTNFRLVCATNCDLVQAVARGAFRSDLYYRIATVTCKLPPLRERMEDIPGLVRHFAGQCAPDGPPLDLDDAVAEYLLCREYPGNVRDLKQVVSGMLARHVGAGPVTVGDIPEAERPTMETDAVWSAEAFEEQIRRALALGVGLKEISHAVTEAAIRVALADEGGNLQRAARKLGVTDRALQMRRAAYMGARPTARLKAG